MLNVASPKTIQMTRSIKELSNDILQTWKIIQEFFAIKKSKKL